jgi:hypothetical protein
MSEIHESITAAVPFERIPALAERYLASVRTETGDAIVPLRLKVGDLTVEREVRMKIASTRRYPGYEIMEVRWEAVGGGPYPVFTGMLCAEQETISHCRLDLDGGYDPPGGIAGAAFDAVLGHRIAEETARVLLVHLKEAFEKSHAEGAAVSP